MRRFLSLAVVLGLPSPVALVGCGEESKVEDKTTIKTPEGSTTTTKETKVETSGSNPPAAAPAGEGTTPK